MHLHAIDGLIMATRVRIRQGVTQPQLVCLRTFLASATKQRKRIVESKAIRTTGALGAPALTIMAVSDSTLPLRLNTGSRSGRNAPPGSSCRWPGAWHPPPPPGNRGGIR